MGLWDELKSALTRSRNEAAKAAAKGAADQAWQQTKNAVDAAGGRFVGSLEEDLENAQEAREGRKDVRPASDDADAIAARIEAAARTAGERGADDVSEEVTAPPTAADKEAKARAELERLKKELLGKD